jgi:hypothetical protein
VGEQCPRDALAACLGGGVHRLDLRVPGIEFLDRRDAKDDLSVPAADERDLRIEQSADVEREAVLRRCLGEAERQVPFQDCPHFGLSRVIDHDLADSHRSSVRAGDFRAGSP